MEGKDLRESEGRVNREDIIKLAREAGLAYGSDEKPLGSVTRFAALVAEHERKKRHAAWHEGFEAGRKAERDFCAAVAEWTPDSTGTAHKIAAAIRARSKQ